MINDFDFQIALAPKRGPNFPKLNFQKCPWRCQFLTILTSKSPSRQSAVQIPKLNFQKCLRRCQFLTILTSKSLSRHSVVQILSTSWAADPPHPPVFRSWLSEPAKPQNYGKTQHFAQFLPAKISHVTHLCCKTSLPSNIHASRPGSNFQYSRKLDS